MSTFGKTTSPKPDDSFFAFDKIATISRKKREKLEAEELDRAALSPDGSSSQEQAASTGASPEAFQLEEGGEVRMVEEKALKEPALADLTELLRNWVNELLAADRMVVRRLEEDLYDGQVFQKLLYRLFSVRINEPEVIHSELGQLQRLNTVLSAFRDSVGLRQEWTVEDIYGRQLVPILRLLVAIAAAAKAPIRLPGNVKVPVLVVQKRDGALQYTRRMETITGPQDRLFSEPERDVLDELFEHQPDRVELLSRHLTMFVNTYLSRLHIEVNDPARELSDGVYFIILLGLLEGYFVPLHLYHSTPTSKDQRLHNIHLLYQLLEEAGIQRPAARAEDVIQDDLKAVLRAGLPIMARYKNKT